MEEDMGVVFFDGKMYQLCSLSANELEELRRKIKQKEEKYMEKIEKILNDG